MVFAYDGVIFRYGVLERMDRKLS